MKKYRLYIFLALFVAVPVFPVSNDAFTVDSFAAAYKEPDADFYIAENITAGTSITDIIGKESKINFHQLDSKTASNPAAVNWLRFKIHNNRNHSTAMTLWFPNDYVWDNIDLYIYDPATGRIDHQTSGFLSPANNYVDHLFITIEQNQEPVFYLRLYSNPHDYSFPKSVNFKLYLQTSWNLYSTRIENLHGLFNGAMLIMILYNLILFFFLKDKNYLYYVIYLSTSLLMWVTVRGFLFLNFPGINPHIHKLASFYLALLNASAGIIFVQNFLQLKEKSARLNRMNNFLQSSVLMTALLSLSGNWALFESILAILAILIAVAALLSGWIMLRKGFLPARFFLTAWIFLITGIVIYALEFVKIIPNNFFSVYSLQIGSLFEMALLSIALADQFNAVKHDKDIATLEALSKEKRIQDLYRELDVARKIQTSLVPVIPEIKGLRIGAKIRPMLYIGGDGYNIIKISDTEAVFLIFDVSGHGIPAALVAVLTQLVFTQLISGEKQPDRLLYEMNNRLIPVSDSHFLTASCVYLNLEDMTGSCANAGHPPVLHYCAREHSVKQYAPQGKAIGILPDQIYQKLEFNIQPGDCILNYTDGIIEACGNDFNFFGEEALLKELLNKKTNNPDDFLDQLFRKVYKWSGNRDEIQDDMAAICIEID